MSSMSPSAGRPAVELALVDVFADRPLTGNPLAVVPDADDLGDAVMADIARELHLSETTFVLRPSRREAAWRLRSFTADGSEVTGAGHNALGGCYLYALDPVDPDHDGYCRFFNPTVGIGEDPATGSAAGPLAGHLVTTGSVRGPRASFEQGHQLGRPSVLVVDVGDDQSIRLSGTCALAGEGRLYVSG